LRITEGVTKDTSTVQMPTADVCRKYDLSQGTFYEFKSEDGVTCSPEKSGI